MAKGKSLCIYGAKGGTGKTIFTINLAGVLSNMQKKVLIIDLDLCNGGIALSLNREVNKTIYNFCDDYNNNRYEEMSTYITKYNEYIDFLAAPKDPRQANKIDSKYIDILIDKCSFMYDVILIDTTNDMNEINVFTLDKTDNILFLTTNDPLDLKNLKNFLNIMEENEIEKYRILLNDSINTEKRYFTLYDIKTILNTNIDYILSSRFYYKDIDSITLNGDIITINNPKITDYAIFESIIKDLLVKVGDNHE
jgi:MinD-like ATPase involved in chromosome partitioning or flagellar assembly